MSVQIIHGDSRDKLLNLPDASVDSVVTDPPYALVSIAKRFGPGQAPPTKDGVYKRASAGFMGKTWDTGETAFDPGFWTEALRVLKPGGHLVAFGGTRTYHRLVCAIEDGGFEIRDQLAWLFGSGFPKSHDVAKGIDRAKGIDGERIVTGDAVKRMIPGADQNKAGWEKTNGREFVPHAYQPGSEEARQWHGWGTALKPAQEPICLARKPLCGTVAANVLQHGTGALNIDASRIETSENLNGGAYQDQPSDRHDGTESWRFRNGGRKPAPGDERTGAALGMYQEGKTTGLEFLQPAGRWPANVIHDGSPEVLAVFPDAGGQQRATGPEFERKAEVYGKFAGVTAHESRGYSGSAARFFYSPKADADDRLQSKHPTVKPVDLMAYLIRLVTPPGGLVLDPFAGSGTTGMAAMREGFSAILIEREAEYIADINRRLAHVHGHDTPLFAELST